MKKMCENAVFFLDPYVVEKDRGSVWLDCRDNYEWYYTYGRLYAPKTLLEVGVRLGYSALSICFGCKAIPPKKVFLIDDEVEEPDGLLYAKECFSKAFPSVAVEMMVANTQHLNDIEFDDQFNMIHVDANHKPEAVRHDFDLFWPALAPEGVMILDDQRSLAGERSVPLFIHILPWLMDRDDVSCWTFVDNHNCQLLVEKR
jgi:predicted O-methyltransferase YrrM